MIDLIEQTVPCTICGEPTIMRGTKLCDNCWEVLSRVSRMDSQHIAKILNRSGKCQEVFTSLVKSKFI